MIFYHQLLGLLPHKVTRSITKENDVTKLRKIERARSCQSLKGAKRNKIRKHQVPRRLTLHVEDEIDLRKSTFFHQTRITFENNDFSYVSVRFAIIAITLKKIALKKNRCIQT